MGFKEAVAQVVADMEEDLGHGALALDEFTIAHAIVLGHLRSLRAALKLAEMHAVAQPVGKLDLAASLGLARDRS